MHHGDISIYLQLLTDFQDDDVRSALLRSIWGTGGLGKHTINQFSLQSTQKADTGELLIY